MKIAFTLCSNNYFAQALLLGQSFLLHNPGFEFYVGLIDEKSEQINYNQFNINILPIAQIEPDILDLALKYNIVELNTAVKPHYFLHFIEKFNAKVVIYLDPDIYVYQNFKPLEDYLEIDDILLTPHILKPIPIDRKTPFENDFLNFGLYNLGFIALKVNNNTINMLNWWKQRTYQFGYHNLAKGLFVDQLWVNLVPILFGKCKIINHPGYNIGPWNLHERFLSIKNDSYFVNNDFQLYFYHFSNYNPANSSKIHTVFTRYDFENRPDLVNIYADYTKLLVNNNFFELKKIPCFYAGQPLLNYHH
ncbi:MAG: glycosyl transferase [Sphingobacteriales bacterium]|nr:MAG: glycosyl transferase [Sphingobacteriales bacterium]